MKIIRKRSVDRSSDHAGIGPELAFAGATLAALAAWGASKTTLPTDWVMPVIATLLLAFSAAFSVVAWRYRDMDPEQVTYADVAGALTLIGLCAAATIDSDQMIRLLGNGEPKH